MAETPELDRQLAIIKSGRAATVQDFYDWLSEQGLHICRLEDRQEGWGSPRYMPDPRSPEQLLADHFGIDRDKIEAERHALLLSLRTRSGGTDTTGAGS